MAISNSYLINGNFNAIISPFDRGFAYGDGVFRTMKMVDGLPECWPLHYQKLVSDCAAINIVCPSADLLMSDLQQLFTPDAQMEENNVEKIVAVAKIIITRGEGNRGYTPPAITAPMRVVTKSPMPQYAHERLSEGVPLTICETRLAAQPLLAGIKTLNRLENVLARMEWCSSNLSNEIADGIMLDTHGNVIECTAANIFARFSNTLITPSLASCGIAGITRQRIFNIAHTLSLTVVEQHFDLEKLLCADAVIICNSLYGAWQVNSVQAHNGLETALKTDGLAASIRGALKA